MKDENIFPILCKLNAHIILLHVELFKCEINIRKIFNGQRPFLFRFFIFSRFFLFSALNYLCKKDINIYIIHNICII